MQEGKRTLGAEEKAAGITDGGNLTIAGRLRAPTERDGLAAVNLQGREEGDQGVEDAIVVRTGTWVSEIVERIGRRGGTRNLIRREALGRFRAADNGLDRDEMLAELKGAPADEVGIFDRLLQYSGATSIPSRAIFGCRAVPKQFSIGPHAIITGVASGVGGEIDDVDAVDP